ARELNPFGGGRKLDQRGKTVNCTAGTRCPNRTQRASADTITRTSLGARNCCFLAQIVKYRCSRVPSQLRTNRKLSGSSVMEMVSNGFCDSPVTGRECTAEQSRVFGSSCN